MLGAHQPDGDAGPLADEGASDGTVLVALAPHHAEGDREHGGADEHACMSRTNMTLGGCHQGRADGMAARHHNADGGQSEPEGRRAQT